MKVTVPLQVAAQIVHAPPHRLIHLCESGCIQPAIDSSGRGSVRRFDRENLFLLAVCLQLQDLGMNVTRISAAMKFFHWLKKMNALKPHIAAEGLCGAIATMGTTDSPALLHIKAPEPAAPPAEPPYVMLQCQLRLPAPPETGFGTCVDFTPVNRWPARVTLNLTYILSTVRLH